MSIRDLQGFLITIAVREIFYGQMGYRLELKKKALPVSVFTLPVNSILYAVPAAVLAPPLTGCRS